MPKILHIGGANSPHVIGMMQQIKEGGFDQAVLSYPTEVHTCDQEFMKDVPIYYYNYPRFFTKKSIPEQHVKSAIKFVKDVINKEKPDIIQGHYPSKCAIPFFHAVTYSKKPGAIFPWSVHDIAKNKNMKNRIQKCMSVCSITFGNHPKFVKSFLRYYKKPLSSWVFSGPPIRLYLYENSKPDVSVPRILIAKRYYQDKIFVALSIVLKKVKNVKITSLLSSNEIMELSRKLGIFNKIDFIPGHLHGMLSQEDFAKKIKENNIVTALSSDPGISGVTVQSAYFGAITLSHYTPWAVDTFKHERNLLTCKITPNDIANTLLYAIENRKILCQKFKKNNTFLKKWDARVTGKNLINAYNSLLKK